MNDIQSAIQNARAFQADRIYSSFTNADEVKGISEDKITKAIEEENPFEKAAEEVDIEKSEILDMISSQESIKISKTGKEIKDQVNNVLLPAMATDLAVKEAEADNELKKCGAAPTKDPEKWWSQDVEIDCGYKIYNWNDTYASDNSVGNIMSALSAEDAKDKEINTPENQEQANSRRKYNDIIRNICSIKVDIKACEILNNLEDKKQFELSPRQILSFKF